MKQIRTGFLLVLVLLAGCNPQAHKTLVVSGVPESGLYKVGHSAFDRFVVTDPQALAGYNKVMLFPMQFDRLTISSGADKALYESWMASNWEQMDDLCQQFDDLANKIFSEGKDLKPTHQGDDDVLAIEFRLISFFPYAKPYHQADFNTVGTSTRFEGIGELQIQAVLANAKTGELVGVIEDGVVVSASAYGMGGRSAAGQPDSQSKPAQNMAWRSAFRHWSTALYHELVLLKRQ